jgi:uncharacterized protein (DUF2147 family)
LAIGACSVVWRRGSSATAATGTLEKAISEERRDVSKNKAGCRSLDGTGPGCDGGRADRGQLENRKRRDGRDCPMRTGKFAGKQIGRMDGKASDYKGEITDPANDKTYAGTGAVTGNSLKMKGCVLAVFCKAQTWTRL